MGQINYPEDMESVQYLEQKEERKMEDAKDVYEWCNPCKHIDESDCIACIRSGLKRYKIKILKPLWFE